MRHELKKVMKIADEVMTCCCYKYEPERASFHVERHAHGYEMVFRFDPVLLDDADLKDLRKKLAIERNPELEDYYWQLAGEVENSSELALVAMMTDEASVDIQGRALCVTLLRRTQEGKD